LLLIDGEAVVLVSMASLISPRSAHANMMQEVQLYAFYVLALDGEDLRRLR